MAKKKKKCKNYCNRFDDYSVPPCAKFLGSVNPLVKDGKVVYRNINRLYLFLSYNYSRLATEEYNYLNPLTFNNKVNGNLQIDLYCFIIGLYINEVEKGNIQYNSNIKIHDDKNADKFIKEIMEKRGMELIEAFAGYTKIPASQHDFQMLVHSRKRMAAEV